MQRGLCQSKVTSSLAAIQGPGHRADNCKMVYSYRFWPILINSIEFNFYFYYFEFYDLKDYKVRL